MTGWKIGWVDGVGEGGFRGNPVQDIVDLRACGSFESVFGD